MTERKYTVSEIDALRRAFENKYIWGWYGGPPYTGPGQGGSSRSYSEKEKVLAVEQQIQTAMMAGHTADDLFESESSAREALERPFRPPPIPADQ